MKYLLDTHALLWVLADPQKLGKRARQVLEGRDHDIYASAASGWEIAIKTGLGKLDFPLEELATAMNDAKILELPVAFKHAVAVKGLPNHHRDPFDRLLIAQALAEELVLITRDEALAAYHVPTLWE